MRRRTLAGLLPLLAASRSGDAEAGATGRQEPADKDDSRSCSTRSTPGRGTSTTATRQIKRLLADRAAALEARDAKALAATAAGGQRTRDRRALANLKALPLGDVALEPADVQISGRKATMRAGMALQGQGRRAAVPDLARGRRAQVGGGWKVVRDVPRHDALPWEVERYTAPRRAQRRAAHPARRGGGRR